MTKETKRLAPIRIWQILHQHSDCDHPLTQEDIIRYLREYGIEMERKAIGRNIDLIKEAGADIVSGHSGCYLASREFEEAELKVLIDGVLCSQHITPKYSKDLIDKLCNLSTQYFRYQSQVIHNQ